MERLAGGDLEADIPAQDRGDEIGAMSGAVQVFKENAIAVKRMGAEAEQTRQETGKRIATTA
jgi:methyl-accepting chemotaxis protein